MSKQIPYIIIEARPSICLPYVSSIKGFVAENKVESHLLQLLIQFIKEQTLTINIDTIQKIKMFWNYFYSISCMKNKHWEAFIIRNNTWESVVFTDEEILTALLNKNININSEKKIDDKLIDDELIDDKLIDDDLIDDDLKSVNQSINYYISSDEDN